MIDKSYYNEKYKSDEIVSPTLPVRNIVAGEIFLEMESYVKNMMENKSNQDILKPNIERLSKVIGTVFGSKITMSIIDESISHVKFFGVNVYPGVHCVRRLIEILAERNIVAAVNEWKVCREWHIEIDGRLLYDRSLGLHPNEVLLLLLQAFDNVVLKYSTINRLIETIISHMTDMDYINGKIAQAKSVRAVWSIPVFYGCTALSFKTVDKLTKYEEDAIVLANPLAMNNYSQAILKITARYGQEGIINEPDFNLERKIMCVLQWIFEGIDCLKNTAIKFVHHLETQYRVCYSPYIRKYLKSILINFISQQGKLDYMKLVTEGTGLAFVCKPYNPHKEKLALNCINEHWKKLCITIENNIPSDYIDKNGFCHKVTREEIDMCVIELDNIQDPDDKIYLLERLYKIIANIEVALEMLNDPKQARKVRQSKTDLLSLREYAGDVRMRILSFKFRPETYGLFVKYPKGYEG